MEQNEVLKALRRDHAAELKLAAERLKGTARHTEIIPSPVLSEMTGHEILLKPENLQVTGSFKIRGAYNKIASLSDEQLAHGIVTASAGNQYFICFHILPPLNSFLHFQTDHLFSICSYVLSVILYNIFLYCQQGIKFILY